MYVLFAHAVTGQPVQDGLILQVIAADARRILVSDGMNTAHLNAGNEQTTLESLARKINGCASARELEHSVFVFWDFSFSFDWDYEHKKLQVSMDTLSFDFLTPGSLHERVFRSKDLCSVLSNTEREVHKREAMKRKLHASSAGEEIEVGELLDIVSGGGGVLAVVGESELLQRRREGGETDEKREETGTGSEGVGRCLVRKGWLTFPATQRMNDLDTGVFESVSDFTRECRRGW